MIKLITSIIVQWCICIIIYSANLDVCFILPRNFKIHISTYINFHSFDREYFDFWLFIGHVTVEFMSTFVPLDRVQVISTQIETAS